MAIQQANKGKYTFVLSSEKVNRHGFSILTGGISLDAFKANPVMLYEHDRSIVLGRWDNIRVEGTELLADAVFDENDEFANSIKRKVDEGFIKACSITIDIKSMEKMDGMEAPVATQSEAWEASIVSIPANTDACRLYHQGAELTADNAVAMLTALNKNLTNNNQNPMTQEEKDMRKAYGLPETATNAELLAAINNGKAETLSAQKNAAEALVNAGVATGKVNDAEKDGLIKLAASSADNYAVVKNMIDIRPVPGGEQAQVRQTATDFIAGRQMAAGNKSNITGGDKATETDPAKMTYAQLSATNPNYLANLMATDKAKFDKLVEDHMAALKAPKGQ